MKRFFLLIATIFLTPALALAGEATPWVTVGADGRLAYAHDARGNAVPDFSNCGYKGGGAALPGNVVVKATVRPQPDGDDGARIQQAIDEVGKLTAGPDGIRGAVLLSRGRYRIGASIRVAHSGVILRGEGDGEDGTVLIATGKNRRALIQVGPGDQGGDSANDEESGPDAKETKPVGRPAGREMSWRVADSYVPVGARSVTLADASGLKAGDEVDVHRPSPAEWIKALGMDHIPPRKDGNPVSQWTAGSKDLHFDRIVTAVAGNRITFDAPIVCALDSQYGGGDLHPWPGGRRDREIGIESLRGISEFSGETDEEHSWTFISFSSVENGWVRNVTSVHFANNLIALSGNSKWVTVQDSTCLDPISQITGGRRYSFSMNRCHLCLVQRCAARNGRHDYVMSSLVAGPNVFLQCKAELTHADAGPHHRWSVGTLYDSLMLPDGELNIRDRGNMGSGHGWAGADQVCWNCAVKSMIVENPPTAQNWAIGCVVKARKGDGLWQSIDKPVQPESIYLAQLKERLGANAVANISKPAS